MTAKVRLHQLVEVLPEPEAERMLNQWVLEEKNGAYSLTPGEAERPADASPFFARLREIAENVPEEDRDRLPVDLAENHDHYIYGTPKR